LHVQLYLGIVLLLVVVVTASFSYLQESKSEAVMEGERVDRYLTFILDHNTEAQSQTHLTMHVS
jgi:hypothetical protein